MYIGKITIFPQIFGEFCPNCDTKTQSWNHNPEEDLLETLLKSFNQELRET